VDPVNGNFTPTTWVEGRLSWVNNAMGGFFNGVWANTDFDIWFVGRETLESPIAAHFDGFSIQAEHLPGTGWLYAVWGSASNDVWAVGTNGLILHWDGTQWLTVPSGTTENLYGIAGTASDDVWAAGKTVMLHWDGSSWANSPGFVPDPYDTGVSVGLAAISTNDAIVATYQGCQRWDGTSWRATNCGVQSGGGIFAPSSDDVWVVGYTPTDPHRTRSYRAHWDGSSWSTTVVDDRFWHSIAGTGPTDIWINGTAHYDGVTWTETSCGPFFSSMSVTNNGAIIGVGAYGIQYFAGDDGWRYLARTFVRWIAMGGKDPDKLWAVGDRGAVIRYDGSHWSGQDYPLPDQNYPINWAFGSSPWDIWATGVGLHHFDGSSWTRVEGPEFTRGFARAADDAITADGYRRYWHWDGTSWSRIMLPILGTDYIREFWDSGPDDAWAVGGDYERPSGSVYHWDGNTWELAYAASNPVSHVGGSASDDAWFTIDHLWNTTVLRWDGTSFTEVADFPGSATGIAATSPSDVWILFYGTLRHYDGLDWSNEPVNLFLSSVLGVPGTGVFITSPFGHIYQSR
jgi:hypothetical protein